MGDRKVVLCNTVRILRIFPVNSSILARKFKLDVEFASRTLSRSTSIASDISFILFPLFPSCFLTDCLFILSYTWILCQIFQPKNDDGYRLMFLLSMNRFKAIVEALMILARSSSTYVYMNKRYSIILAKNSLFFYFICTHMRHELGFVYVLH